MGSRDLITGGVFRISGSTYSVVVTGFSVVVVVGEVKIFKDTVEGVVGAGVSFFSSSSASNSGSK